MELRPEEIDPLLKLSDIALVYGISAKTMQHMIKDGIGPPVMRIGQADNSPIVVGKAAFLKWRRELPSLLEQRAEARLRALNTLPAETSDDLERPAT